MSFRSSEEPNIIRPAVFATPRGFGRRGDIGRRSLDGVRQGDRDLGHDLRTPLNAIIGFSEMMLDGAVGDIENERHREYLEHVRRSGLELLETVRELLEQCDPGGEDAQGKTPTRSV